MELTAENVNDLFDYREGVLFWKKKVSRNIFVGKQITSKSGNGYLQVSIKKKMYPVHRIIFLMFNGYLPKIVDHIDRNPLNNRIENLREATNVQSGYNRGLQSNNTSGTKGVVWNKKASKWQVQLWIDKKYKYFGVYSDKGLAELVAIEATNKYHKEFSSYGHE